MRVIYIHQYFYTGDEPGPIRSYAFARHLADWGHQVTMITASLNSFTASAPPEYRGKLLIREERDGIHVVRTYAYPSFRQNARVRLLNHVSFMVSSVIGSLFVRGCDVVYATSPPPLVALSGYIISRLKRAPFVFEVRDLWPEGPIVSTQLGVYDVGIPAKRFVFGIAKGLVRFLYRQADRIVILTPAFREPILVQGVQDDKITLIPHGIDPKSFHFLPEARERIREELGTRDRFVVTYAGAFGFAQRLDFILDVAEHLKEREDVIFWLIGDGPKRDELVQTARHKGLGNVVFIQPQDYRRMPEFLSASDLCLILLSGTPVHNTVWPNKLFDYMACDRPILINFDGVTRAVLEEANAGFYVPRDAKMWADKIVELSQAPKLRQSLGANARDFVVRRFDRRRLAQEFERLLLEVTG